MRGLCLIALVCVSAAARAEDAPVTPYRPSVSNPAQLPAAGQLELEAGVLRANGDGQRQDSLPFLFKLAFSEQWGMLLGGDAYVSQHDANGHARGVGDTSLILKRAFGIDKQTALGIELGVKLPTAPNSLGNGHADYSINSIFSRDLGQVHLDANASLTRIGGNEAGTGRNQTGWSTALSVPLTQRWGATAELSGTHRAGVPNSAQILLAAAYSPNPRMTIDVGLAHGLTSASPDWSLFSGIVLPVARLW